MVSISNIKKLTLASMVAAVLGGCASSVPLDAPVVEDRAAASCSA